jgi:hypothetical protein
VSRRVATAGASCRPGRSGQSTVTDHAIELRGPLERKGTSNCYESGSLKLAIEYLESEARRLGLDSVARALRRAAILLEDKGG